MASPFGETRFNESQAFRLTPAIFVNPLLGFESPFTES